MAYFKLEHLSFYTQDNTSKYIANTIGEFTSQAAINTQNKSTEELKKAFSETCNYLSSFKFNQSNFCFCFDEKFSIQTHSQCSLTFSMMEYILLNGQRFKNPFVSILQPGSLVLLTTQEGDEYLLNIESRSLDISETNSKYTYTCTDNFTYTLSKQETAYEIENNSDDEDYIGAKTVDWWAYKITQETKMPYKYLPLQWSYLTHGTNYPASLQSKVSYSKPAENDTTNENYMLFQTTAFSGSGSANSILITLAESYGLMIKTKIVFDRSAGTIDYYYWFETIKNSNWTGLSYTLDSTISSFSISEKMDSFGSVLNVTGGTIGDDQVTLLPEITPFFSNLFLSQAWSKDNFYQNYFTSVIEYGNKYASTDTSLWKFTKSFSLTKTAGFLSEAFNVANYGGYNYLRCANDKLNEYSTIEVNETGRVISSRVNNYYIIPEGSSIAYEEHEEIPSQYHNVSYRVFVPCDDLGLVEDTSPYAVNFYCQWMRNPTEEDLAYAQAADRCPWLENRLIDFSYYYDHNIINGTTLKEMNNYLKQDLRYINGKLAVYLNQYYSAVHKKTTILADIVNKLDLVGANFASAITDYYRTKGVIGDISTTSSLYSTYTDVFSDSNDFQSSIINYSDTISDYVNKFFDSQQRFFKNIKNFTDYFNEPYKTTSNTQLTLHQYQIYNQDATKGYSFTTPKYQLFGQSDLKKDTYISEQYTPLVAIYQKLSDSAKYQRIEPTDIISLANINATDGYEVYTPKYNQDNYIEISGWNSAHNHYIKVKQSFDTKDGIFHGKLITQYTEYGTRSEKISYEGGYYKLTIYNALKDGNSLGSIYYKGTTPITEETFNKATQAKSPLRQTTTAEGDWLQVSESDIINYLHYGIIPLNSDITLSDYYILNDTIKKSALDLMRYLLRAESSTTDELPTNVDYILGGDTWTTCSLDNYLQLYYIGYKTNTGDISTSRTAMHGYLHSLPLSDLTIETTKSKSVSSKYITASNYDQYYRFISTKWLWTDAFSSTNWWKGLIRLGAFGAVGAIGSAITDNDGSMGRSGYCFEDIAATDVRLMPTQDFVSLSSSFWGKITASKPTAKYQGIYTIDNKATTTAFAWFDLALAAIEEKTATTHTLRSNLIHLDSDVDADVTYTTTNLQWIDSNYQLGTNRANIGVYVCKDTTQYTVNDTDFSITINETHMKAEKVCSTITTQLKEIAKESNFTSTSYIYDVTLINSLYKNMAFGTFSNDKYLGMTVKRAYETYINNLKLADGLSHNYTIKDQTSYMSITDNWSKTDASEQTTTGTDTFYVIFFEKLTEEKYLSPTLKQTTAALLPEYNYVNSSYLIKDNIKTSILQDTQILNTLKVSDSSGIHMGVYTLSDEISDSSSFHGSTLSQQLIQAFNLDPKDSESLLSLPTFYRKDSNGEFYRVYSILQYIDQEVYFNVENTVFNTCTCTLDEIKDSFELIYFTTKEDGTYETEKKTVSLAFDEHGQAIIDDNTIIKHSISNQLSLDGLTNGQVCYILSNEVDSILTNWNVSTDNKSVISDAIYELSALIETNLETYWTSAYNASLSCDYYIPENWTSYANSSANYFYQYLFDFHTQDVGSLSLSVPTIKNRFIPQISMINKPQQKLKKYILKHYAGGKLEDIQTDIELLIDYNQDPSWAITNTNLNETVQDKANKLQSIFGFSDSDLDEWYVVEGGYANYYEAIAGGMKWNEVIPFLSQTAGAESRYGRINGLYAMTVDILHNYYRNTSTTNYETYRKLQQEAWRTFYQKYPGLVVEQSYENTDALTSEELYNFAYAQFKDINKPEYDFSATVIEATKLKGYTGQELHIGDPIKIEMQDVMDTGKDNTSLQQLLYISGISYSLRKDSSTELTLNTLKYNDKLAQKLAKLIK